MSWQADIPLSASIAPTEMSMPPISSTSIIPNAMTIVYA